MKAITVVPGRAGSAAPSDHEEPRSADGPVLVATLEVGICGTDLEIAGGSFGAAPIRLGLVGSSPGGCPCRSGAEALIRQPDDVKVVVDFG